MAKTETILLDPVTRIEGHLAVKTHVEGGRVARAEVAGQMFRGFEVLLRGRHPLDAQQITQRICGVCPIEHGMASVQAQDMAYGIQPPTNGRLLRNLVQAANFIASHITHFYLVSALDFVEIARVVEYTGRDAGMLGLKAWVQSQLASKSVMPAAPFLPRYAAQYLPDRDLNLGAIHHYLQALDMRRDAQRMGTIFAGKMPHAAAIVPGGMTETVSAVKIESFRALLDQLRQFIDGAYLEDVVAVAGAFPAYFATGRGCGNYLSYGVFAGDNAAERFLPAGVLTDGKLAAMDAAGITEDVKHSLFSSHSGLAPSAGQTVPAPDKPDAYSWLKAPRYQGQVMEVGPLARMLVATQTQNANPAFRAAVAGLLKTLNRPASDLNSVLGRHAARALECKLIADQCDVWLNQLVPGEPASISFQIPTQAAGHGLTEAARGALGHWIDIQNGVIVNYQCVVPTTWNCSPRDDRDAPGALEQALVGTPVADAANPIEVARVIRSFDPCLACAVH